VHGAPSLVDVVTRAFHAEHREMHRLVIPDQRTET
jgi:hypothetical protein